MQEPEDPVDIVARLLPRHVWVSLAVVLVTVLAGLLFFEPAAAPGGDTDAPPETVEGRVVEILRVDAPTADTLLVEITRGPARGEQVEVRYGEGEALPESGLARAGDRVLMEAAAGPEGQRYFISEGFSVLILSAFVIRGILAGHNPLLISLVGSFALLAATLYLTYGWRPKTHAALAGLGLSLIITGAIAVLFVNFTRLNGLGSESALFLRLQSGIALDLQGIFLAGIMACWTM